MKKKKLELIADPGLFLEYAQADASSRLDRENAVLHGVKILGFVSLNGRRYTVEALERACALYENAKVNVNHPRHSPQAPRDYQDRIGNIRNVRFQKNEGLYADFHFNPRHPLAEQLMWDAEHAPENVGFSHNIAAKTATQKDGSLLVEEILLVRSVDLVADPATTHGLFESQGAAADVRMETLKEKEKMAGEAEDASCVTSSVSVSDSLPLKNGASSRTETAVSARTDSFETEPLSENAAAAPAGSRKGHSKTELLVSSTDEKEVLEALQTEFGELQEEIGTLQEEIGTLQEEIGTLQEEIRTLRRQFQEMLRFSRKISVPVCRAPQVPFRENELSVAEFVTRLKSDARVH
ncbi:MAG: hypothetical protein IJD43_07615 [Thermoguttaceae bacterium]|nr:hypothetical protein [Thermoguttaceae bacterium]